ncbi:hypothetical protein GCM10010448_51840 [Streptomyces glomeratus]|uniref:Uncharacterized protein n=1 Tax=Streptomyces glomeratus TaxID=284452 RepID=A0ABP6LY08_9ACTN
MRRHTVARPGTVPREPVPVLARRPAVPVWLVRSPPRTAAGRSPATAGGRATARPGRWLYSVRSAPAVSSAGAAFSSGVSGAE